jgi:hypothetical protein
MPPADVVSEKAFTKHSSQLQSWIKYKKFELMVIDEAHGIGTLKDGKESGLYNQVMKLVGKSIKLQVLLISSDPGWTPKNEKLYSDALGLTGSHKLENRVLQRDISKFNMPKEDISWFPRIGVSQSELERIQTHVTTQRTEPTKKISNLRELALTLPFDLMAQHLGDHVDCSTEHEQWAIWACRDKEKLRKYLERRDIKCSPIYRDKGGIKLEDFAREIMKDTSLQVVFPPESHERGIGIYKDIKNYVFWDESEPQWMTEDRRRQIMARHARRDTKNTHVTMWRFKVCPDHPHSKNLKEWNTCKAIPDGPRPNLRAKRDDIMAAGWAKLARDASTGGAAASTATATASLAGNGKLKRKRPTRGAAAESDPVAASPPSSGNPGKRMRSTPEAELVADESMAQFLSRLGLKEYASKVKSLGIDTPADFIMFSEDELINRHKIKDCHARKMIQKNPAALQEED